MAQQDLISPINKKDLSIFKKDFIQLMRVNYGMNDYYVKADPIATKILIIFFILNHHLREWHFFI